MDRIQQQIKRLRDKNTRPCEERSSWGSQPGIANLPCDAEIVLPVGRQAGHIDLFMRDRIRDVNFQEWIPFRQILHVDLLYAYPHRLTALAAGEQEKFWDMHDLLFAQPRNLKKDQLVAYATQLNLDVERFQAGLAARQY